VSDFACSWAVHFGPCVIIVMYGEMCVMCFVCRKLDTVVVTTDIQLLKDLTVKDVRTVHACVETVSMVAAQMESPRPWVLCSAHIFLCLPDCPSTLHAVILITVSL